MLWANKLGSDFYTQFFLQRAYRNTQSLSLSNLPNSVIKEVGTFYPIIPAILYAKITEKYVIPFGICLNYTCDFVLGIIIYFYVIHLGYTLYTSGLFAALWLTLPILHPINARLIGLGARTIGTLLVFIFFLGLILCFVHGVYFGLFLSVISAVLVFLSSQFGTQALLLLTIGLSIGLLSPLPIIIFMGSLGICFTIPSFEMAKKLRLKRLHIEWYLKMYRLFLGSRNSLSVVVNLIKSGKMISLFLYLIQSTTPFIVTTGISGLIVLLSFMSLQKINLQYLQYTDPLPLILLSVSLTGFVGAILTFKGPLSVFGESERYIEYITPFLVLLTALCFNDSPLLREGLLLAILCSITLIIINLLVNMKSEIPNALKLVINKKNTELYVVLQKFGYRRIATSPLSLASELSLFAPQGHLFIFHLLFDTNSVELHWPKPPAVYPYLDLRESSLEKLNVNTVIISKKHLGNMLGVNNPVEISEWGKVELDDYIIYLKG